MTPDSDMIHEYLARRQRDPRHQGGEWDPPRDPAPDPATEGKGRPWRGVRYGEHDPAAASPAAGPNPPGGAVLAAVAAALPGIHTSSSRGARVSGMRRAPRVTIPAIP